MSDSRRLVIRFQQLTEVPDWVWDRTDLEFLCVSDNRLTGVSPRIASLTNLRALDIAHNAIESVPDALGALPNLSDYLYLSDNKLTAFPEAVTRLATLRYLGLTDNRIAVAARERRRPRQPGRTAAVQQRAVRAARGLLRRCRICASSTCPTTA